MDDLEIGEDGIIDWEQMFSELPEDLEVLIGDPPLVSDSPPDVLWDSSPDSVSSWIGEIENLLMRDDNDEVVVEHNQDFGEDFLAGFVLDHPADAYADAHADASSDKDSTVLDSAGEADASPDKNSNVSGDGSPEQEKINGYNGNAQNDGEDEDQASKKRRRQLRNRDAAVRSRERKKTYVRDLELKSRYLESECRRLGHLLQCCFAENQTLRLHLQNEKAFGASVTKQESAVLLMESLLLGSLLWFLGIMCLALSLPVQFQLSREAVPMGSVEDKGQKSVAPRGPGSKIFELWLLQSYVKSKRCKASKTKMKPGSLAHGVLV